MSHVDLPYRQILQLEQSWEETQDKYRLEDSQCRLSIVRVPAFLTEEAVRLTKTVTENGVRGEAAVGHGYVDGLLFPGLRQQFVAEPIDEIVDFAFQLGNHAMGEELGHGSATSPMQVMVFGAEGISGPSTITQK